MIRSGEHWLLIDLDAAHQIGTPVGKKSSPAVLPPEMVEAAPDGKVCPRNQQSSGCALAHGTFDAWGFGLMLYLLSTGQPVINHTISGDLDDEAFSRLLAWDDGAASNACLKIRDLHARDLVSKLLRADPRERWTIEQALEHPFFSVDVTSKLLFVSTPGRGHNPMTGLFDLDVMGILQQLCSHHIGRLVIAYDWAGSSSGDPRDKTWFDKIFEEPQSHGKTLFESWVTEEQCERRERLIDEVQEILAHTMWLSSYKGSVKAQIRQTCQSGAKAILIRIDGGPITRVEARLMSSLISEAKADLRALGIHDPVIELHAFGTVFDFQVSLPEFLREMGIASLRPK